MGSANHLRKSLQTKDEELGDSQRRIGALKLWLWTGTGVLPLFRFGPRLRKVAAW